MLFLVILHDGSFYPRLRYRLHLIYFYFSVLGDKEHRYFISQRVESEEWRLCLPCYPGRNIKLFYFMGYLGS